MSGTYAEPGSQTISSSGRRDQVTALCRNCGYDIVFFDGPDRPGWRHLVTDDHRCTDEDAYSSAQLARNGRDVRRTSSGAR